MWDSCLAHEICHICHNDLLPWPLPSKHEVMDYCRKAHCLLPRGKLDGLCTQEQCYAQNEAFALFKALLEVLSVPYLIYLLGVIHCLFKSASQQLYASSPPATSSPPAVSGHTASPLVPGLPQRSPSFAA